jgi:hypothetical protein
MKKILLAGFLLTASTISVFNAIAAPRPTKVVTMALPKPVSDAFARLQNQYASDGFILTNVQWTRVQNRYTASFSIVDLNSDSIVDSSASWLASGHSAN